MRELKRCPFCDVGVIYETQRENELGTVIPQLFCNSCKMIFEIENDSPYLNDEKTYDYLKEKLYGQWNTRKPVERALERLEEAETAVNGHKCEKDDCADCAGCADCKIENAYAEAIEIIKEEVE